MRGWRPEMRRSALREDSGRGAGVSQKDPSGVASPTGSHDTGSSAPPVVLRHLWLQRACWNVCTKLPSTGGRWRQEVPPVARSAAGDRTAAEFVCSHVPMSLQPCTLTPRLSFTLSSLGVSLLRPSRWYWIVQGPRGARPVLGRRIQEGRGKINHPFQARKLGNRTPGDMG